MNGKWGWVFWAVLALSLGLRIYGLGSEALWIDEGASWDFSQKDLAGVLRAEPTNPPLYYLMLHFWTKAAGVTEEGLRSLSVLGSLLGLVLLYVMAWQVHPKTALGVAVYGGVSAFQIYYAQEARGFAWLSLWILASSYCLWTALETEPFRLRARWWAGFAIFTALGLYTHFLTTVFLLAQGLYLLWRSWGRWRALIEAGVAAGAALLVFSPWLLQVLRVAGQGASGQNRRYLLLKLPQAYFSFLFGDYLIPLDETAVRNIADTLRTYAVELVLAVIFISILAGVLGKLLRQRSQSRALFPFVVWMAVVPVLLAWGISFRQMIFDERYLIAASPFLMLVVVEALRFLLGKRMGWLVTAGFTGLVLLGTYRYYFAERSGKEQWREAVAYIEQGSDTGDVVLLDPDFLKFSYQYYQNSDLPVVLALPGWEEQIAGASRVWMIHSFANDESNVEQLQRLREQDQYQSFPRAHGMEVYVFGQPR